MLDALRDTVGLRTLLAVPMIRDGVSIGAITVQRWGTPRAFSDAHVELLRTFAAQAVIAIENVRLFNETREALEQQTATSEILRVISSSPTDLQPVLDTVVASAARYCGAYDATMLHLDGGSLRLAAHHGPIPIPVGRAIPVVRGTTSGRAVLERRPVHVTDIQAEVEEFPESGAFAKELGYRTQLSVPLLREGAAIGTIVLRRTETNPFTDKQITLLQTFAAQAVIAIENVRLFTELEARNRDLTELLGQQTATAQILRVISSSPTDVQPVFDTIVRSALRLCNGATTAVFRVDGGMLHHSANYGGSPEALAAARARYPRPVGKDSIPGIAILTRSDYEVPDTEDPSAVEMSAGDWANTRDPKPTRGADAARRRGRRRHRGDAPRTGLFRGSRGLAAEDVRRPGGDRHRERASLHGAGGAQPRPHRGPRAADGDERDAEGDQPLRLRPAARVRRLVAEARPASSDDELRSGLPVDGRRHCVVAHQFGLNRCAW